MRQLVIFLASAGYVGYIPVASGTFGTLVAIPLLWVFAALAERSVALPLLAFAALVAAACWIAGRAEEYFDEHDSGKIVIDEVAGFVAAILFLPPTVSTAVIAFFVFRLFDIIKPFPARYIDQHVRGGAGVVLDDVFAGFYANLVTRLILLWWPFA